MIQEQQFYPLLSELEKLPKEDLSFEQYLEAKKDLQNTILELEQQQERYL